MWCIAGTEAYGVTVEFSAPVPEYWSASYVTETMSEAPYIEFVDCTISTIEEAGGKSTLINPDGTRMCETPVSAEETTWGRVKGLYRQLPIARQIHLTRRAFAHIMNTSS
jgi:hypothetical protein